MLRSSTVTTTTWDVPGQVTGIVATAGNGHVNLTWTAPASTGTPVTGYRIYRNNVLVHTAAAGSTSFTDTGLENGVKYTYRVATINAMGEGTPSEQVDATPGEPPVIDPVLVVVLVAAAGGGIAIVIVLSKKGVIGANKAPRS